MLAIRAGRVFDGEALVDNPVVVVDGAHIASLGVDPPADAEVVDLGDATLLPGLIDTHQHLVFSCVGTFEEMVTGVTQDELFVRARENALRALQAGVTTIRDLGDKDYVTLPLRSDPSLPTLLCSGPPITVPNGHCWYLGGETEPAGVVAAVNARADQGCDVVKVMVSGGFGTPTYPMWESQFSADDIKLLVDTAHARGLPVAAHCHGVEAIHSAAEARVDTIEHCTFVSADGDSHPTEELVERVLRNNVVMSATLGFLPNSPVPPQVARNIPIVVAAMADFHHKGGTLVIGTDAGISPGKPHDVHPNAFTNLVEFGFERLDALRAMTSDSARAIGLADRKGRLAAGYDADLLAVAGNPLADGDLLTPVGVWKAGKRVVG